MRIIDNENIKKAKNEVYIRKSMVHLIIDHENEFYVL